MKLDVETENKFMKAFIVLEGLGDKFEKFKQSNMKKINGDSNQKIKTVPSGFITGSIVKIPDD